MSNGAYKLKQWIINEKITAERNPFYWNDKRRSLILQNIYFKKVWLPAYQRYQAKELDLTWIPVDKYPHSEKYVKRVTCGPRLTTEFYTFNVAETTI